MPDGDDGAPPQWPTTESAMTYVWLEASLGLAGNAADLVSGRWTEVRDAMRRRGDVQQEIIYATDWISDYWVTKGTKRSDLATFAPMWSPPEELSDWPSFDIARLMESGLPGAVARTAFSPPRAAGSDGVGARDWADAAQRFIVMESEIERHGDATMVHGEYVRAWLKCAVGDFLKALVLSPEADEEWLRTATVTRLSTPLGFELPSHWVMANEFEGKTLELLYSLRMGGDGQLLVPNPADIRVGQAEGWRESWDWLSEDFDLSLMGQAIQLAARIMRCKPVVQGLLEAAGSAEPRQSTIALAVVRRWLLTLRVMHWLEGATYSSWRDIRSQDLACFAFSAVKPEWPRRVLAVSHRSVDTKPALRETGLWWSGLCALDASYVPSWETNTGMIWSLFGACPAILRLVSDRYAESVWCRREAELSRYLRDGSDFMAERWIIDAAPADISSIDEAFAAWREPSSEASSPLLMPGGMFREFPPMVQVWTPSAMPVWETRLFRASAALRGMNQFLGDVALTNRIAEFLLSGTLPPLPIPAPTNNPDGWSAYTAIFRELVDACALDPNELPIRLPDDYSTEERQRDADLFTRLPDLSSGVHALDDCLVALEFLRTEWPAMVEEGRGRFLAANCRDITREQWAGAEQLSLHRGLISIRAPVPVWILQRGGQQIESWGLPGDRPIFTEYLPNQFSWMMEIFLDRGGQQAQFPADSGLWVSAALQAVCQAGGPEPKQAGSGH
jgi:hypothetical protein